MRSTRWMVGAAIIGSFVAVTVSGASAQEQGNFNGRANARAEGNHVGASAQLNGTARQSVNRYAGGRQMSVTARENRGFAEGRNFEGRRRMAAENGYSREWRDRRAYGRVAAQTDGIARRDRLAYRGPDRDVAVDVGVATGGYEPGYYAYSTPDYVPAYAYAPVGVGPYYDYAPGFSVGIGPVGIGVGPAWDW